MESESLWPVLTDQVRDELAAAIDGAARQTRRTFDQLPLEDRLTGKFFGLLDNLAEVKTPSGTRVSFNYRTFDGTTEREVGADGAIVLSVRSEGRTRKKVLLFQAKRLTGHEPRTRLSIRAVSERQRLARQLDDLYDIAGYGGAIGLFYSRAGFYAVDTGRLLTLSESDPSVLRTPLVRRAHPWPIGLCIAHLALTCQIGNTSPSLVREVERDGLKAYARRRSSLRHRLELKVRLAEAMPEASALDDGEQAHDAQQDDGPAGAREPTRLPAPATAFEQDYGAFAKREESPALQNFEANLFKSK